MRMIKLAAVGILFLCVGGPAVRADEPTKAKGDATIGDPTALLKEKGLHKIGSYWVLPDEKELQERLKGLKPLERDLEQALKLRSKYDRHVADSRNRLMAAIAERRRLAVVMMQVDDRDDAVAVAQQINVLSNQIDGLVRYVNDPGPEEQIDKRIGAAADALYDELHGIRTLVDETQVRYEALAGDVEVAAAIAALAEKTGRNIRLGPRKVFSQWIGELGKYEAAIQSDDIKLEKRGGVFMIDTVVNGMAQVKMVFDTGAGLVSLPASVARDAGVVPNDNDPVIRLQVADGRVVEGRLVFLDELSVGEFSVKNVECAVLPPSMDDAEPLLGGSFLRHFSIKMNHAAGTLTLTQITAVDASK